MEERIADFVAQSQRVVWHAILLGLVSTHTQCIYIPSSPLTVLFPSAPSVIFWYALFGFNHKRFELANLCIVQHVGGS